MMTDFLDFVDLLKTGELNGMLLGAFIGPIIFAFSMLPGNVPVNRYTVRKGRQEIEIVFVSERPSAENNFHRDWAKGELSDGQVVWVALPTPRLRNSKRVAATVVCSETLPVTCIGSFPVPVG